MKANTAVADEVVEQIEREITQLDPLEVLADKNTRYSLKKSRIESLKEDIIRDGGITSPVEVEPLSTKEAGDNPGKAYRLTFGHYRLAALLEANKEGHNFTLPAMIVEIGDPVARLRRQLAENMERENQSPIDKAIAIKTLMDMGVDKMEVRNIFATPGGRKGSKLQPASNSFINMTLSFLELPKKIQTMIHEGEIGVADAYWLTKQPADKQEQAVETAIAHRLKELALSEEEENKFLEEEKKRAESEAKAAEAGKALETAKKDVEKTIQEAKDKAAKAGELYLAKMNATDAEAKKAAEEAHKVAEAEAKEVQKALDTQRKELKKQEEKAEKQKADAEARAEKLRQAREAIAKKAKPTSANPAGKSKADKPLQVQKSAAIDDKNRPNTGGVRLTQAAMMKVVEDLCLPSSYAKVQKIAKAFKECFSGRMTDSTLLATLATITGEKTEEKSGESPAPKAKKAAAKVTPLMS